MSDVEKYIKKKETASPGFKQKVNDEILNLRIGEEIRKMRTAEGMTQEELAKKMSTTKSAISRLENHSESVRLSTIEKVAEIFKKKVIISFK
ncbi:MAG: helix-turn-helix transcriptional regulator [Spirochaetales bacterium]|nr:helix-turn-helix transcriptional regulator [Spirochaetales bacterium]